MKGKMQIKKKYLAGGILIGIGLGVVIAGVVIGSYGLVGGGAAFLLLTIGCGVAAKRRTNEYLV